MIIENKKLAGKIRLVFLFLPVLFTILIAISYYFKSFPNYFFYAILFSLFIGIIILIVKLKLYYLYFNDSSGKITVRYLTLGPFGGRKSSIEIPHSDFMRFEIKKSFYGYKKDIIFYRKTSRGIAKYPPVSVTALNESELMMVKALLIKYVKQK